MNSESGKSFKRGVEGSYTYIIAQRRCMACGPETLGNCGEMGVVTKKVPTK